MSGLENTLKSDLESHSKACLRAEAEKSISSIFRPKLGPKIRVAFVGIALRYE